MKSTVRRDENILRIASRTGQQEKKLLVFEKKTKAKNLNKKK